MRALSEPHPSWSVVPGLAVLAVMFRPLLDPGAMLAARDLPVFHLPLRTTLKTLLAGGIPEWNPLLHGGQPILSNPNYAAFYPPTWFGLAFEPQFGIGLVVVMHGLLAFAGAWVLARRLGTGPTAAAIAATGFAGAPWFLALSSTLNFYCGMAWFPWILAAWLSARRHEGRRSTRWLVVCSAGLGLQLLAGEPVAVLITAMAIGALAITSRRPVPTTTRALAVGLLAAGLAAVQLVPTAARLGDSPRESGLEYSEATLWSARPARLVELAFPRVWGDPNRDEEGKFFGWNVHDRSFPYVVSLYAGLVTLTLAMTAAASRDTPFRKGWMLAGAIGVFLGLGRHNPLYPFVHTLPILGMIRYPEKFLVLAVAVLPFLAALGWDRIQPSTPTPSPSEGRGLAFGTSAALVAIAAAVTVLVVAAPGPTAELLEAHSGLPPSPQQLASGLDYVRSEALVALAVAGLSLVPIALTRRATAPRLRNLALLLILAADCLYFGWRVLPVVPADEFKDLPPSLSVVTREPGRIYRSRAGDDESLKLKQGPVGFQQLYGRIQILDPYVANLWGVGYVLHEDYDLMLTDWGRHALSGLGRAGDIESVSRLAGAWNARHLVHPSSVEQLIEEIRRGEKPRPVRVFENLDFQPRFRLPPAISVARDREAAMSSSAATGFRVHEGDTVVSPSDLAPVQSGGVRRIYGARDGGDRVEVEYETEGAAYLIFATTYDRQWQAADERGEAVQLYPTGLGQIAAAVPPGHHTVTLAYRDRWVRVGAVVTLFSALIALALVIPRGRVEVTQ